MKIVIPILAMSAVIASNGVGWSTETATGSLGVKFEFKRECKVDPGAKGLLLDFGRHLTLDNVAEAKAIIKVQCTDGVGYNIYIDSGKNTPISGVSAERKMSNGKGDVIDYEIYQVEPNNRRKHNVGTKGMPTDPAQIVFKGSGSSTSQSSTLQEMQEKRYKSKGGKILSDYQGIASASTSGDGWNYVVFGRVLKPENGFHDLPTGTYSDTLRVTVSF